MDHSGRSPMPRARPPPPVGDTTEDPVASSAMLALERLTLDKSSLQSEVKQLRDQVAAERQEHTRLTENYRATHEDDIQKLLNERKLAASLAEENTALKADVSRYRGELLRRRETKNGPGFAGNVGQILDEDIIGDIERELAVLRCHVVRLRGKRLQTVMTSRKGGDTLAERKQAVPVQLRRINSEMEDLVQAISRGTFGRGRKVGGISRTQTALIVVEDLAHLRPPLTEYSLLKNLHERFDRGQTYTRLGPHLVSINPYAEDGADCSTLRTHSSYSPELETLAREVLDHLMETGQSQSIVLTGESGSGKTHAAQLLVRSIFQLCGGSKNADTFKVLAASLSMLQSLSCAWTEGNSNASRVGHFIELTLEGKSVQPACYWYYVDQGRVAQKNSRERNFHIFYQMLAGLTQEERAQYQMSGYSKDNLNYLKVDLSELDVNQSDKQDQFAHFKNCMAALRIPFADVMRILAAVLLLGNVEFSETAEGRLVLRKEEELKATASLLGVTSDRLMQGLTLKTKNVRGQVVQSRCSVDEAHATRDCLSKTLYSRTVSAIMRRSNACFRRNPLPSSGAGTGGPSRILSPPPAEQSRIFPGPLGASPMQSDSPMLDRRASSPALSGAQGQPPIVAAQRSESLDGVLSPASTPVIGILDMFGFENAEVNRMAQLCINLCSETLHSQFGNYIFTDVFDSVRSEGIESSIEMPLESNKPVLDLILEQDGILDQLDRESLFVKGTTDSFMEKLRARHGRNPKYIGSSDLSQPLFGIKHYNRNVIYDASHFLSDNRDSLSDDTLTVFHRQCCNFKFANHLFQLDLKGLPQQGASPQGQQRRILPGNGTSAKDDARRTFSQDFHTQLAGLLRVISSSEICYVRCVKSNMSEEANYFDRAVVTRQLRSLLVLETAHMLVSGFVHHILFREFSGRYHCLLSKRQRSPSSEALVSTCHTILATLQQRLEEDGQSCRPGSWAVGTHSVFFKEKIRQQLDWYRTNKRQNAVIVIQRGFQRILKRKRQTTKQYVRTPDKQHIWQQRKTSSDAVNGETSGSEMAGGDGHHLPVMHRYDVDFIKRTCCLHGLDMDVPPPVPVSRPYTVRGNMKLSFPHKRVVRQNFKDEKGNVVLYKGEQVDVVGASPQRGFMLVEHRGVSIHVPSHFLEVKVPLSPGTSDL